MGELRNATHFNIFHGNIDIMVRRLQHFVCERRLARRKIVYPRSCVDAFGLLGLESEDFSVSAKILQQYTIFKPIWIL